MFIGAVAIADTGNHRVLLGNGLGDPRVVIGQRGSFATNERNKGGISNDSLDSPSGVTTFQDSVSSKGHGEYVFVADTGNHRLLGFDLSGPSVYGLFLLGQDTISANDVNKGLVGPDADRLSSPHGLAAWSLDKLSSSSPPPELGIYVADTGNHRVLHFPWCNGLESGPRPCSRADRVWGQPDFVSSTPGVGPDRLDTPTGVAVDRNRGLWIADTGNHRVLHFRRTARKADVVLGQPDFTTHDAPTTTSATTLNGPTAVAVSETSGDVYVADPADSRILRYAFVDGPGRCDDDDPCTVDSFVAGSGCTHVPQTVVAECFPYLCDLSTRACTTDCSSLGCQAPFVCVSAGGFAGGRCEQPCDSGQTCQKGTCADGWCCDAPCTALCAACNQPGNEGRCRPVSGPPPPRPPSFTPVTCATEGEDDDCAGSCSGRSDEIDRCVPASVGTKCGVGSCVGGVSTGAGTCDGAGHCVSASARCFPYACGLSECRTACFGDLHCGDGARCIDGACIETSKAIVASGGCGFAGAERDSRVTASALAGVLGLTLAARRRRRGTAR